MNQYSQLFLKKMASSKKSISRPIPAVVPLTVKQHTIFKQLARVCKLLHMNELEIVVWSLWVDDNNWAEDKANFEDFLMITGLQAKVFSSVLTAKRNILTLARTPRSTRSSLPMTTRPSAPPTNSGRAVTRTSSTFQQRG